MRLCLAILAILGVAALFLDNSLFEPLDLPLDRFSFLLSNDFKGLVERSLAILILRFAVILLFLND